MFQDHERWLFAHSAHRSLGVVLASEHEGEVVPSAGITASESPSRVSARLVAAGPCDWPGETFEAFRRAIEAQLPVQWSRVGHTATGRLPAAALDGADCLLFFGEHLIGCGRPLCGLDHFCRRGGTILGIGIPAPHVDGQLRLFREVFGVRRFREDRFGEPIGQEIVPSNPASPLLEGVDRFDGPAHRSIDLDLAPDATILLASRSGGRVVPVAWTRRHLQGRVFCTSLCHADDFNEPSFVRLLANVLSWSASWMPDRL